MKQHCTNFILKYEQRFIKCYRYRLLLMSLPPKQSPPLLQKIQINRTKISKFRRGQKSDYKITQFGSNVIPTHYFCWSLFTTIFIYLGIYDTFHFDRSILLFIPIKMSVKSLFFRRTLQCIFIAGSQYNAELHLRIEPIENKTIQNQKTPNEIVWCQRKDRMTLQSFLFLFKFMVDVPFKCTHMQTQTQTNRPSVFHFCRAHITHTTLKK